MEDLMKHYIAAPLAALLFAAPAMADDHASGDPEAGKKAFNKCKACHMVEGPDETFVKGGKVGPNLYGVIGRTAGSVEDFRYSKIIVAAGEGGLAWDEESFVAYAQDPTGYLQEVTGDNGRGKMTYKARKAEEVVDIWAYLASVSPAPES
jgi:cytochrome c